MLSSKSVVTGVVECRGVVNESRAIAVVVIVEPISCNEEGATKSSSLSSVIAEPISCNEEGATKSSSLSSVITDSISCNEVRFVV